MDPHLLLNPKGSRAPSGNTPIFKSSSPNSPSISSHTLSYSIIDGGALQPLPPHVMSADSNGEHDSTASHPSTQSPTLDSPISALSTDGHQDCASFNDSVSSDLRSPRSSVPMSEHDDEMRAELTDEGNGSKTPQRQGSQSLPHRPVQPMFDPHALLNPKAPPKRPASETGSERGRDDGSIPNHAHFIEKLHNVHERTASPAKRVKTDDESKQPKSRAGAYGSGALEMGAANGQQDVQPRSTAIDLTMSDEEDGDVKLVKDNGAQIICIGRIKQVYVQLHAVPYPDPNKFRGNYGQQARIKVSFRRGGNQRGNNVIMVVDPTGREFGRVDAKTAVGLAPLMDAAKLNGLQWLALTEPRRKYPNEGPPGSPLSALVALTVQLYCPRKVTHEIGKYLKHRNIELIDPIVELSRFDYFNPQTAKHFNRRDAKNLEFEVPGPRYAAGGNYVLRSVEEIRNDVLNMFDAVLDSKEIPTREPNAAFTTPFYKHQKQALYFMADKEHEWATGDDTRKDSLYRVKHRDNGQPYYLHVITGEEMQRPPTSSRGGILADEMGLGKTLSVLSLIADEELMATAKLFATKAPPISQGSGRQVLNSRATLLVCPLSTMVNWKKQIGEHLPPGYLKWTHYHGGDRHKKSNVTALADHDLVITTYQIVGMDAFDQTKPLSRINWFRIVLDEAHAIRTVNTKQSKGACELAAQRRWAVTGTPVQNRLEDLGALLRFLRLQPFHEAAGFNLHILNPFKLADPDVVPKLQLLVSSVTLRRLKKGNIGLPPRSDQTVYLKFSEDERRLHEWFEKDSARQVNAVTRGEKLGGHAYARILKAILYLRLICAHGRDLLGDEALKLTDGMTYDNPMDIEEEEEQFPVLSRKGAYEMLELLDQTDTDRCQYCRRFLLAEDLEEELESDEESKSSVFKDTIGFMTPCYHVICNQHVAKLQKEWDATTNENGRVTCQFCEGEIRQTLFELKRSDFEAFQEERERIKSNPKLSKKMGAYTGPHTKTKALLDDLHQNREESLACPDEPPIKSVIFSCWTTHLDLIQIALENHSYSYTRLDGRMDRKARDRALTAFCDDPSVHILLVSIGAGGLGLNLTSANKVYVMEPQFNPAAEAQAVDRVHRLGQTRPVFIKRFIMENSFEVKMLDLQRKKKDLADLTMAREKVSKEEQSKKKLEDLRSLFR